MANIRPFRAYRYNLGRVGALADVVAPPYDVIDSALQDRLYQRSPFNVIRLILDRELPADTETDNRYTRSARFLRDWQQDGILAPDAAPSLYVYHQDFEVEGKRFTRRGFLARVRLEKFGQGKIFPHEETLAGPKADRLKLFRATGMNLSPVFGLFPDEQAGVQEKLDAAVRRAPPLEATDHLGVVNRLWPISDQHVIGQVASTMAAPEDDPERCRPSFVELRRLRDRLRSELHEPHDCRRLSMGMSNDFEIAIEEGATLVRLGTVLISDTSDRFS